jgi:hypothetical protein
LDMISHSAPKTEAKPFFKERSVILKSAILASSWSSTARPWFYFSSLAYLRSHRTDNFLKASSRHLNSVSPRSFLTLQMKSSMA